MENTLIVAEVFYSIQGEGQTVGIPSVFLRLGGCNLLCKSDTWVCDTIDVWKKGRAKQFQHVLGDEQDAIDRMSYLSMGAHLVITGGEPLMQQEAIVDYLNWFRSYYRFTPIVEIETNGTITPNQHLLDKVDYWNVSPKLKNSGMPFSRRVNEAALISIQTFGRNKIFKFVISKEEDLVFDIGDEYGFIQPENIMLMPAGDSVESLANVRIDVAEICKRYCYRFSDRLHISLWNKKTGV
jgi:7-carboxy-7-deazaguanine synthase